MINKNIVQLQTNKLNSNNPEEIKIRCEHANETQSEHDKCLVGDSATDWMHAFEERLKQLDYYNHPESRKLRDDAVIGLEVVTSINLDTSDISNIDIWTKENIKWAKDSFGEENVMHGFLHMGELNPHIHLFVTPIKDGRFNAREVMGDKSKYAQRQIDYTNAMISSGFIKDSKKYYINELYKKKHIIKIGKTLKETEKRTIEIEKSVLEEWDSMFGWVPNQAALYTAALSGLLNEIKSNKVEFVLDLKYNE